MAALTVRELITKWSFKTNQKDIDDFNKALELAKKRTSVIGVAVEKMGKGLSRAGSWLSTRVTLPIIGVGAAMVKAAADAEESESKFDAVFKDLRGGVREWSEDLATRINRSGYELREFASRLQDTFVPLGFTRDKAASLSKEMTELALDVASFNNVAEDETMSLFTSAIVGNHEAVRRFGIVLTQSQLDKKIKELSRSQAGFTKLSKEQQKVMARYKIIVDSTSDSHGDAERTAGSFTNRLRGLNAKVKEASITWGKELLPILTPIVAKIGELADKFGKLDPETKKAIVNAALYAAALGPVLLVIGKMISVIMSAVTAFRFLAVGMKMVFRLIMANPLALLIGSMLLLAGTIIENWNDIVVLWKESWMFLRQIFEWIVTSASGAISNIVMNVTAVWEWISGIFNAVVAWFVALPGKVWEGITGGFQAAFEWVWDKITKFIGGIKKRLGKVWDWLFGDGVEAKGSVTVQVAAAQTAIEGAKGFGGMNGIQTAALAGGPPATPQTTNTTQVQAPITVNVPPGTPESMAQRVGEAAGSASKRSIRSAIGDVRR